MSQLSPSRIVCAACRLKPSGLIIPGARHWDMTMRRICEKLGFTSFDYANAEQGFIDQHGKFFNRKDAFMIANGNGQIREHSSNVPGTLFSEDLY